MYDENVCIYNINIYKYIMYTCAARNNDFYKTVEINIENVTA